MPNAVVVTAMLKLLGFGGHVPDPEACPSIDWHPENGTKITYPGLANPADRVYFAKVTLWDDEAEAVLIIPDHECSRVRKMACDCRFESRRLSHCGTMVFSPSEMPVRPKSVITAPTALLLGF